MINDKAILVGVDGSHASYKATWWAANYAKHAGLTLQIVCTILKGAGKLTRAIIGSLRFTRIDVVLGVRGEDPAEAARSYGRLNAWLYPTLGFLDRFVYLDFEQLRLLPDPRPAACRCQALRHRCGRRCQQQLRQHDGGDPCQLPAQPS